MTSWPTGNVRLEAEPTITESISGLTRLGAGEEIDGFWVDPASGALYLSSKDFFTIGVGVAGDKNDLYLCAPGSLGEATACTPGFFWDAGAHGLEGGNVRDFSLIPAESIAGAQAEPAAGQMLHLPLAARP